MTYPNTPIETKSRFTQDCENEINLFHLNIDRLLSRYKIPGIIGIKIKTEFGKAFTRIMNNVIDMIKKS